MADKGTPEDGPSLEMPSLPFGRKKRRGAEDDAHSAAGAPTVPTPTPTPTTTPIPATAPPARRVVPSDPHVETRTDLPPAVPAAAREPDVDPAPARPRATRQLPALPTLPGLPALTGVAAALATGAVVGALGVLLVWLAARGCEAARGTASCGDGPGFLVLAAVLVVLAYLGGVLLRSFGVPDAGSTSLLAVGVMAVLVLVLFTDSLFEWWMALAVPVVSAAAYALSWWVSTRAVPQDEDEAPSRL